MRSKSYRSTKLKAFTNCIQIYREESWASRMYLYNKGMYVCPVDGLKL